MKTTLLVACTLLCLVLGGVQAERRWRSLGRGEVGARKEDAKLCDKAWYRIEKSVVPWESQLGKSAGDVVRAGVDAGRVRLEGSYLFFPEVCRPGVNEACAAVCRNVTARPSNTRP